MFDLMVQLFRVIFGDETIQDPNTGVRWFSSMLADAVGTVKNIINRNTQLQEQVEYFVRAAVSWEREADALRKGYEEAVNRGLWTQGALAIALQEVKELEIKLLVSKASEELLMNLLTKK